MGGGGLRILPHKKWHVWRRDNIERVLRDEREVEEQQQAQEAKDRRLEQERRAQKLLPTEGQSQGQRHINLFQAEETQINSRDGKKRGNGAEDTLRKHGRVPWYAQAEDTTKKEPTARQERKRKRELEVADPLHHMRPKEERPLFAALHVEVKGTSSSRYQAEGEGPAGSDRRKYSGRYDHDSESRGRRRSISCKGDGEDKRSKKRHKHHKDKSKHKTSKKDALLQELRREHDEREASERRRANKVMYG